MENVDRTAAATPTKKKKTLIVTITLVAVAAILATAVFILFHNRKLTEQERQQLINSGVFHEGITVNSVPVGGLTIEEAKAQLSQEEARMKGEAEYQLTFEDQSFPLTADDLNISFNTDEVLAEAMLLGRDGNLPAIKQEIADIKENGRVFTLDYSLDAAAATSAIAKIAAQIDCAPVDATFAVNPDSVGAAAATEEEKADSEHSAGTEAAESDAEQNDAVSQTDSRFIYTQEVRGVTVSQDELLATLSSMAAEKNFGEVAIPVTYTEPAVTVASLKETIVLRGSYKTFYGKSPYNRDTRVFNMEKAAGLVNGTVLAPGQVFSTNDTLGNRTYASGWKPAPAVILGGAATEDQAGGGVCQVSSTLYVSVLQSDLEIVYRQAHSQKLSYVPGGLDATIDSGRIDFQFKNNTQSPLYIFMWLDKETKYVHCEIYGEPFPDTFDSVVASSKRLQSLSPEADKYITVSTMAPGSIELFTERRSGSIWQSYVTYYKDGKEVETKEVATSKYPAHPNVYHVGPGYGTSTPSVQTTPPVNPSSNSNSGGLGVGAGR